jgi:hypothetical protein
MYIINLISLRIILDEWWGITRILYIIFWKDKWLDDVPLSIRFNGIFKLSIDNNISVTYMCRMGWLKM